MHRAERHSGETGPVEVLRFARDAAPESDRDITAREEPLEIRVRGRSLAVVMRTPGNDNELAAGFLLSEGLIRDRRDVVEIAYCRQGEAVRHDNVINVFLAPSVPIDFERLTRHVFASSSCGICGKASIDAVHQHFPPVGSDVSLSLETILKLPERLRAEQPVFGTTGGLHAAAIFDEQGQLVVVREDVGRHNAVDKAIGFALMEGKLPLKRHVLLVSGRASFEIVQKALSASIPIVAAISAPSSLAVEFARESGQTLIGFLRGSTMNVYSHGYRVRAQVESARG